MDKLIIDFNSGLFNIDDLSNIDYEITKIKVYIIQNCKPFFVIDKILSE